jgi:phage baseplate assembly protein gpV
MLTLFETIRRIVREELGQVRTAELAVVQEIHPHARGSDADNYACTVRLRDSGLVLRCVPVATSRIGAVSIPAVGELALVQFLGGDVNAPVLTGLFYNDQDRPPINHADQAVWHLPLDAAAADAVHVELHSGPRRQVVLTLGDGLSAVLRDDDPVVELNVAGGKATVSIDRDGAVTIASRSGITLQGGDVQVRGDAVTVEATGELKLKGTIVNIN